MHVQNKEMPIYDINVGLTVDVSKQLMMFLKESSSGLW